MTAALRKSVISVGGFCLTLSVSACGGETSTGESTAMAFGEGGSYEIVASESFCELARSAAATYRKSLEDDDIEDFFPVYAEIHERMIPVAPQEVKESVETVAVAYRQAADNLAAQRNPGTDDFVVHGSFYFFEEANKVSETHVDKISEFYSETCTNTP